MKLQVVMICRRADEPTGYKCESCGRDLHVTEEGKRSIVEFPNIHMLCNPCGIEYSELFKRLGILQGVALSETALEKLKQGEKGPVADWLRKNYKGDN